MSAFTPLYNIMLKEEVTEENLAECRKVIYNLLSMENKVDSCYNFDLLIRAIIWAQVGNL